MKNKLLLPLTLLIVLSAWVPVLAVDSEYIQEYPDNLIISLYASQPIFKLKITNKESGTIQYVPNTKQNTGVGISYRGLGISGAWTGSDTKLDETIYGRTKYRDYQFNFYLRKVGFDVNYQEYRGFYLDQQPVLQRPDLKMMGYGANFYYIFNYDRFSFRAAFNQTERQKKNAGSWLLMTSAFYLNIKSDGSLIPPSQEIDFGDQAGLSGGQFVAVSISPGYAYTAKWHNWYLTPSVFLGPGYQYQHYLVASGVKNHNKAGIKGNIRIAFGYNGEKFFMGFALLADATTINQGQVDVESTTTNSFVFLGYRF